MLEVISPGNIQELQAIIRRSDEYRNPYYLAGGTDLVLQIRSRRAEPDLLVELGKIETLKTIADCGENLIIGSMATFTDLVENQLICKKAPVLAEAAAQCAAPQVRNQGTIGGNIANASPAADLLPPLLALNAKLNLLSPQGRREVPVASILKGVGENYLKPLELIEKIKVPLQNGRGAFVKLGIRNSMVIARISTTLIINENETGLIERAAISLGAVAPTVVRIPEAEAVLNGKKPHVDLLKEAMEIVVNETKKYLGQRASAPYKIRAVRGVMAEAFFRIYPALMEGLADGI